MPRTIYNPKTAKPWNPAKAWVDLSDGSSICVWELSVPEQFQVAEAAQRHPQDPRPGANDKEAALWLLAYACRKGDGTPEAPSIERVFSDLEIGYLMAMAPDDFGALLAQARGLVQPTEAEEAKLRDFTPAMVNGSPASLTGVSSTSTDSLKNLQGSDWEHSTAA
jgi:hypothetical protein